MKILVVGDFHAKDFLSYSDYVKDRRVEEKEEIIKAIQRESADCGSIVFMGDNFDHRNNSAEVVRDFVRFIESLGNKEIYMLSGNHERKGNGTTAIDFLKEVNKPNWHIITHISTCQLVEGTKVDFLPYTLRNELEANTDEEASKKVLERLNGGDILFHHHVVSGNWGSVSSDMVKELVLDKGVLESKYELIVGGHIHSPVADNKVIYTGSVFNSQVGETGKYIWKIDPSDLSVEQIPLPGRKIYQLFDPEEKDLTKIKKGSILKVIVTKEGSDIEKLKEKLSEYDAYLLTEQYPSKRSKVHFEEGALDTNIENLLKIYSEVKKVDISSLMKGYELIK